MESDLLFEIDCQRRIGEDKYNFFCPLSFGDFVIYCWMKQRVVKPTKSVVVPKGTGLPVITSVGKKEEIVEEYGLTFYENGEIIDPTHDKRFKKLDWAKSNNSWFDKLFTKDEVCQALADISLIGMKPIKSKYAYSQAVEYEIWRILDHDLELLLQL